MPLLYPDLSYDVVGAAIDVHQELGPGLLERVYREALCFELRERGIPHASEVPIPVTYKGRPLGIGYQADIVVAEKIVLELKVVNSFNSAHSAQLLTYMRLLKAGVGYLFNFKCANLVHQGRKRLIL